VLGNGNVRFTYTQSRSIVDNTYGANAVGYGRHFFHHLWRSDNAEFSLTNGDGEEVMYLIVDYLHRSDQYPSGYGTLGVLGGDGSIPLGDPGHVVYVTTSLTENLNRSPAYYGFTTDSPPEPDPHWDYFSRYTVEIAAEAFGPSGFGAVDVVTQHNSPAKNDQENVDPEPCERCITNPAYVPARAPDSNGIMVPVWSDSDTATVCVFINGSMHDISGTIYLDYRGTPFKLSGVPVELRRPDGTVVATIESGGAINEDGMYVGNYAFKSVPNREFGTHRIRGPLTPPAVTCVTWTSATR